MFSVSRFSLGSLRRNSGRDAKILPDELDQHHRDVGAGGSYHLCSPSRFGTAQRLLAISYGWKYVDRESLRQVANYGSITFMIIVAARLRFKTDAVIIG